MTRRFWGIRQTMFLFLLIPSLLGQLGGTYAVGAQTTLSAWAQLRLAELDRIDSKGEQGLEGRLERVRAMYFLSVDEGEWVDPAKDSLSAIWGSVPVGSREEAVSQAYLGALEVVRAKHSRWPPNKLRQLESGARILDDVVARQPDNLETRYLRLASYIFLPIFLRRDDSVDSDLQTLAANLPDHPEAFSPPVYQAVVRFVLEHGALEGEERTRMEKALKEDPEGYRKGQGRQEI